ncbi:HupE/UreJ family protein [Streptomyces sp. NPDC001508]|uniref:HupE/UreJ family protein n=1 Tax=Streptomyces sp. NPDC001508 TaxID=3154656 RepID=UPI00331F1E62
MTATDSLGNTGTREVEFTSAGIPDTPAQLTPASGTTDAGRSVTLSAKVAEPDGGDVTATFSEAEILTPNRVYQGTATAVPTTLKVKGEKKVKAAHLAPADGRTLTAPSSSDVTFQRFDVQVKSHVDQPVLRWEGVIDPERLASLRAWNNDTGQWDVVTSARGAAERVLPRLGLTEIGGYQPEDQLQFGASFFRLLQFDVARSELTVDTYSPLLDEFGATEYDTDHRYDGTEDNMVLPIDLNSRKTTFRTDSVALYDPVGVVGRTKVTSGEVASVTWRNLKPGSTTRDDATCTARTVGAVDIRVRGARPYAVLTLAFICPAGATGPVTVSSALFPDAESFVHSTRTIVHYDIDGGRGSRILTVTDPSVTAAAAQGQESHQVREFFWLGTEHLLFGLDHILFLLSLLIGARGLRDITLTATAFTAAHSITFLLAACGVVDVPAQLVEPVIAASIAVVAIAAFRLRDRTDTARRRLPIVFVFGLVHGLGFAGSLGIDERWSWELLLSLLSFNVGIEAVQLGIILVVFPLLLLLRRSPVHRWVLPALTAPIVLVSLYWLWDRVAVSA